MSVYPEYFLREESIDYTISGEAEINLRLFINFISKGTPPVESIPGIGWRKEGSPVCNPVKNYTSDSEIIPVIRMIPAAKKSVIYSASVSRGCPLKCRFCANYLVHGRGFRHCTTAAFGKILKNFSNREERKKIIINFEDDNLLCDTSFLFSILDICKAALGNVAFSAENGLDYRMLTPRLCESLTDAGFIKFNFTLGSVSPVVSNDSDRQTDVGLYDMLLEVAEKRSIPVTTYIICGSPGDTKKKIADNLRFLYRRNTITGVSLFYPVPGICGFENRELFGRIEPQLCAGASAYPWNRDLSTRTLITAFRLARFMNLMKADNTLNEEESEIIKKTLRSLRLHTIVKEKSCKKVIKVPNQDFDLVEMVLKS